MAIFAFCPSVALFTCGQMLCQSPDKSHMWEMFHLNRGGGSNISKMKVGRYLGGTSLFGILEPVHVKTCLANRSGGCHLESVNTCETPRTSGEVKGAVKKGVSVRALSQGDNKKYPTGPERGGQEIKLLNRAGPKIWNQQTQHICTFTACVNNFVFKIQPSKQHKKDSGSCQSD